MDEPQLQTHLREVHNLRLQPAMSRYLSQKVQAGGGGHVAVIGGDAKTGRAVRVELPLENLTRLSPVNKSELS